MKREAKLFAEKQRRAAQNAELDDFSECTFHPKISEAPAYVKKIARSMSLSRSVRREQEEKKEGVEGKQPKWR